MTPVLLIYAAGVLLGLAVMRDGWPTRVATALVWPLGPLAFVLVVSLLLVAAAVLWPIPVLGGAILAAALVWMLL